ncbi:MAG: universal stress protein [Pseudomonadota bacterium]
MRDYRHVLLATDFSPHSEAAAQRALDLIRRYGAHLSLIHVIEELTAQLRGAESSAFLTNRAQEALTRFAERLGLQEARMLVEWGSPRTEILRVAQEQQMDLIVLGSHGQRGHALLLGSTANAVLHSAPCDVLAVRAVP